MTRTAWVITVVAEDVDWRVATAAKLVTEAGLPIAVAVAWVKARRELGPSGLKKKLAEQRN